MFTIAALYKFVELPNITDIKKDIVELLTSLKIKGTILLAAEGINGTIAGCDQNIKKAKQWFDEKKLFKDLEYKESYANSCPFYRLKVKVKAEIVTLRQSSVNPFKERGRYVDSKDWNELIQAEDVTVIDVRNAYETDIGSFKGAIKPQTNNFTEFPSFVQNNITDKSKKIAMFCTGGIRCEKASAYMLTQGFSEVYNLKGGILQYLEDTNSEHSMWQGDCFVFDQRVSVNSDLNKASSVMCYGCRMPLTIEDTLHCNYEKGVSCHKCNDNTSVSQKNNFRNRQKQIDIAKSRGQQHIGAAPRTQK